MELSGGEVQSIITNLEDLKALADDLPSCLASPPAMNLAVLNLKNAIERIEQVLRLRPGQ